MNDPKNTGIAWLAKIDSSLVLSTHKVRHLCTRFCRGANFSAKHFENLNFSSSNKFSCEGSSNKCSCEGSSKFCFVVVFTKCDLSYP